jgi:hypothetical protein
VHALVPVVLRMPLVLCVPVVKIQDWKLRFSRASEYFHSRESSKDFPGQNL